MKNLQSIEEGKWVELLPITLTDSEKVLLLSKEESDAKTALVEKVKTDSKKSVSATIASKAKAKYNEIKPSLKDADTYEFITADFVYDDANIASGILNCRINGQHKQVRF